MGSHLTTFPRSSLMSLQITESLVSHIINDLDTMIPRRPEWSIENGRYFIDSIVENSEGLNLRFYGTKNEIRDPIPRFSYLLDGLRIRGIDWHLERRSVDGRRISGWHEHIFHDKYKDNHVVEIEPGFDHIPHENQIDYVLNRWGITYSQITLGL